MEIALKAFIYHYMYTRDSQSLAVATAGLLSSHHHSSKTSRRSSSRSAGEYDSSSSDGGGLTRRWSVRRIMSYLRRIEERQGDEIQASLSETPLDQDAVYSSRDLSDDESTSDTESTSSTGSAESNNTDGIPLIERRGRRFLAEKLGVHGDDQNIVIVSYKVRMSRCQTDKDVVYVLFSTLPV